MIASFNFIAFTADLDFMHSKGVDCKAIPPYAAKANGRAKRMVRTIKHITTNSIVEIERIGSCNSTSSLRLLSSLSLSQSVSFPYGVQYQTQDSRNEAAALSTFPEDHKRMVNLFGQSVVRAAATAKSVESRKRTRTRKKEEVIRTRWSAIVTWSGLQ